MRKIWLLSLLLFTNIQSSAVEQLKYIPVPLFGHYYPEGYHLMGGESGIPKHCVINKGQAKILTPHATAALSGESSFFISIVGTRGRKVNNHADAAQDTISTVPAPWNILFHGWSGIPNNTADNVNMGVFDYKGIEPVDLGINTLKPLQVYPHGVYCSPNNAKFNPHPITTQFMTFGLVGSYKGKSILIYQIIINNEAAQDILDEITSTIHGDIGSIHTLIQLLTHANFKQHFTQADDILRLKETIIKLKKIIQNIPSLQEARHAKAAPAPLTEQEQLELAMVLSAETRPYTIEKNRKEEEREFAEILKKIAAIESEEKQLALARAESAAMAEQFIENASAAAAAPVLIDTQSRDSETMTEEEKEALELALALSLSEVKLKKRRPPVAPRRKAAPTPPSRTQTNQEQLPSAKPRRRAIPASLSQRENNSTNVISELEQLLLKRRQR